MSFVEQLINNFGWKELWQSTLLADKQKPSEFRDWLWPLIFRMLTIGFNLTLIPQVYNSNQNLRASRKQTTKFLFRFQQLDTISIRPWMLISINSLFKLPIELTIELTFLLSPYTTFYDRLSTGSESVHGIRATNVLKCLERHAHDAEK